MGYRDVVPEDIFHIEEVSVEGQRIERSQQYYHDYNSIQQPVQAYVAPQQSQGDGNPNSSFVTTENEFPPPPPSSPSFREIAGFDLVDKIRTSTEDSKQFILTITQNQETLPLVEELIETNPCVGDLDGYIGLLERYGKNVELAAPQLEDMYLKVLSVRYKFAFKSCVSLL